jgi:hypothetical protein
MRYARRIGAIFMFSVLSTLVATSLAQAHIVKQVGPYSVAIGWVKEPTYVGEQNAVQVVIKNAKGEPVRDLSGDDLKVVVSVGGKDSDPMALEPTFDEDTGLGIPGDYEAPLIPTALGAYTFHVTGSIHGTALDEKATASDTTFDEVVAPTAIQFPAALPPLDELVTRIERTDARAGDAQSAADDAGGMALIALIAGISTGGLGILLGLIGIVLAIRARPRPTS